MFIPFLLLHLYLITVGLQAANEKGPYRWFVIETRNDMNSIRDMDPLFNIIRKETNSGKIYEIEKMQSKNKDTESGKVDIYDEIDQPGDESPISEEVSGITQDIPHLGCLGTSILLIIFYPLL